ncbi:MAG: glycosyltransferase [Nitrososphaerota archaeon]|nr:glycosyltransferase [Nitrososphaerota archaeon]
MDEFAKRFEFYCFAGSRLPTKNEPAVTHAKVVHVLPFRIPRRMGYRIGPLVSSVWINSVRPNVVWLFDTAGPLMPLLFERPIVLDSDDPYILMPGKKSRVKTLNELRLLRDKRVKAVVVPTELIRSKFVKLGLDPEEVHVIPNGVDTNLFRPTPLSEEPVVLYHGAFPEFRARLLAQVVELTCRLDPEVKFILIGDVPVWFKRRIAEIGCADRVQMPGFVPHDELPKWLERARVCCFLRTGRWEEGSQQSCWSTWPRVDPSWRPTLTSLSPSRSPVQGL